MACCKGAPYIIYKITCSVSGKSYIGVTKHLLKCRWKRHLYDAEHSKGHAFQRAIRKHGKENFDIAILYESDIAGEMVCVERAAIAAHGTFAPHGYNQSTGGEFQIGWRMTPELCATRKPMLGKTHTAEAREKIAASKRGKKLSPERVEQIRQWSTGRKHRPESKEKVAAAKRGIPRSEESKTKQSIAMSGRRRSTESIEKQRKSLLLSWDSRRVTHCRHGHEYTEENTYRKPTGDRECGVCMRARNALWRERAIARAQKKQGAPIWQ